MKTSSNYGLKLMEGTDNVKRQDFVDNFTKIDSTMKSIADSGFPLVNAIGTNAYTGTNTDIKSLTKGLTKFTLFVGTDATGNCSLNLNSWGVKNIKDSNDNIVTNLKKDIPYNVCYNGTDFILQGKGGGGNLIPKYLLAGYYGEGDNGRVDGSMKVVTPTIQGSSGSDAFTNNAITGSTSNANVGAFDYAGVNGYVENLRVHIANLLPQYIKSGVKVGGEKGYIQGTFTSDANAQAAHILSGYSGYVNGNKVNGNMANRGAPTVNLNAGGSYSLSAGYYSGGKINANSLASQSAGKVQNLTFATTDIVASASTTLSVNLPFTITAKDIIIISGTAWNYKGTKYTVHAIFNGSEDKGFYRTYNNTRSTSGYVGKNQIQIMYCGLNVEDGAGTITGMRITLP